MDRISLVFLLDRGYRQKVERFGVKFEHYLTGVIGNHLLNGGALTKLVRRLESGSVAARMEMANRASWGRVSIELAATQSQASLSDQLDQLEALAVANGLYDAHDWVKSKRGKS